MMLMRLLSWLIAILENSHAGVVQNDFVLVAVSDRGVLSPTDQGNHDCSNQYEYALHGTLLKKSR
jgi:hypothetical protein